VPARSVVSPVRATGPCSPRVTTATPTRELEQPAHRFGIEPGQNEVPARV
jgi:hypothetical protein